MSDLELNGKRSANSDLASAPKLRKVAEQEPPTVGSGELVDDFCSDGMDDIFGSIDMDPNANGHSKSTGHVEWDDDEDEMFADVDVAGLSDTEAARMMQLDLSGWNRCAILAIHKHRDHLLLIVQPIPVQTTSTEPTAESLAQLDGRRGRCCLLDSWTASPVAINTIVSIQAVWQPQRRAYCVDRNCGYLVLAPDQLISGTTVTGAVFCQRKAVLADRYPGIDGPNRVMLIGTFVHLIFQSIINQPLKVYSKLTHQQLRAFIDTVIAERGQLMQMYEARITSEEIRAEVAKFEKPILDFIRRYCLPAALVTDDSTLPVKHLNAKPARDTDFCGHIARVVDIEESLWVPQLGLKGKVDVTAQVRRYVLSPGEQQLDLLPLELKTGRATFSAEHRGQIALYQQMMEATGRAEVHSGLLLYLRDGVMREVHVSRNDQRDLIMLRNQIAYYAQQRCGAIVDWPAEVEEEEAETNSGAEATAEAEAKVETVAQAEQRISMAAKRRVFSQRVLQTFEPAALPEPINHHSACSTCAYNTICCAMLQHSGQLAELSANHPLRRVQPTAIGHLSPEHIAYFVHWSGLLALEETASHSANAPSTLWTQTDSLRHGRRQASGEMCVPKAPVTNDSHEYVHIFAPVQHQPEDMFELIDKDDLLTWHPFIEGQYVRVSVYGGRRAVAGGRVSAVNGASVEVPLDRDLSQLFAGSHFVLDAIDGGATQRTNAANLAELMADTFDAARLRRIVIDGGAVIDRQLPPLWTEERLLGGVPGVARDCNPFGRLNAEQRRAVQHAMHDHEFVLLRGLPGTGKTQTIAVLLYLLTTVRKLRVLVTSHTHSAVDTLLKRFLALGAGEAVKLLRLGDRSRIAEPLRAYSLDALLAADGGCGSTDEIRRRIESCSVVGVTCLGANNALLTDTLFDVCIMDEATQVLQPTALRPLQLARRFMLIGDPDQLPPIVRCRRARSLGAAESLFERLDNRRDTVSLQRQYRMNTAIMRLANEMTYNDALLMGSASVGSATLTATQPLLPCYGGGASDDYQHWVRWTLSADPERSRVLLITGNTFLTSERARCSMGTFEQARAGCGLTNREWRQPPLRLYTNYAEAAIVMHLVEAAMTLGIQPEDIGVIAPYNSQVDLLRRVCPAAVECSTVDQFQGRDKSIIVLSCTKCDNDDECALVKERRSKLDVRKEVRDGEVLADMRRMAVAITRAKHKFIVIGDMESLQSYQPFAKLFRTMGDGAGLRLLEGQVHFEMAPLLCAMRDKCWPEITK